MNVYEMVTHEIIKLLDRGVMPWRKEWVGTGGAWNRVTGKEYSLLNQVILGKSGEYATFAQWKAAGGTVRKGAKSRFCVFYKPGYDVVEDGDVIDVKATKFCLRYYNVFHIDDVDGVEQRRKTTVELPGLENKPIEKCHEIVNAYLKRTGMKVESSDAAAYHLVQDYVSMPDIAQFNSAEAYYAAFFHELSHSTGHPKRLSRDLSGRFGSKAYAREELVAEMSSAFLSNITGIGTETLDNSAAYIESWRRSLMDDSRLIVVAANRAEKATKYILGN